MREAISDLRATAGLEQLDLAKKASMALGMVLDVAGVDTSPAHQRLFFRKMIVGIVDQVPKRRFELRFVHLRALPKKHYFKSACYSLLALAL